VKTVIEHFRGAKFVDPGEIVIEGVSRGAVVASMVAAQDSKLRAVVLIGGVYDMKSFYNGQCLSSSKGPIAESICGSIRQEMPITDQGFAERSALMYASKIKAHVLILHGAEDQNAPAAQAEAFAAALQKSGANVELHVFPGFNHQIPLAKRQLIINAFLKRNLNLPQELPQ
jgi:dipeptidyl aminopeptidase/acylaminoacyl peptidase